MTLIMKTAEEKTRLRNSLSNAISLLCRSNLGLMDLTFSVEALIGINVNDEDVMVVSFKETYMPDGAAVSYVWQKQGCPDQGEDNHPDDKLMNSQNNSTDKCPNSEIKREPNSDSLDNNFNDDDILILEKIGDEKSFPVADNFEGNSNNNYEYGSYNSNTSSPDSITASPSPPNNPANKNNKNKRRKQSAPIKVCPDDDDDNVNDIDAGRINLYQNKDYANYNDEDCLNLKLEIGDYLDSSPGSNTTRAMSGNKFKKPCVDKRRGDGGGDDNDDEDVVVCNSEDSKISLYTVPYFNNDNNSNFSKSNRALTFDRYSNNNNNNVIPHHHSNDDDTNYNLNDINHLAIDNHDNIYNNNTNQYNHQRSTNNNVINFETLTPPNNQSTPFRRMMITSSSPSSTTTTNTTTMMMRTASNEQPQNYTYKALCLQSRFNASLADDYHGNINNNNNNGVARKKNSQSNLHLTTKKRKSSSSHLSRSSYEHDANIISDLLPYLFDQHRPMLIPPTVTQFAPKKRCRVCYSKKIRKEVRYCCFGCIDHPGLCLEPCFYQFHLVRGCVIPKISEVANGSGEGGDGNEDGSIVLN